MVVVLNLYRNESPLALYVFTKNKDIIDTVLKNVRAGGICVNDTVSHAGGK